MSEKVRVSGRPVADLVCSLGEDVDEGEIGGAEGMMLLEYPQQSDGICRARLTTC